jgi:hypothetical protein
MNLRRTATICVFAWLAGAVSLVIASGPLHVTGPFANQPGQPYRWTLNPIPYTTDKGLLGNQTNTQADALVADAFNVWHGVSTASISFQRAGQLGTDITENNILTFQNAIQGCNDPTQPTNAIIYDVDGSIVEALGDDKDSILGFAGPACFNGATGTYTRGWAVLNGWFIDGSSPPPGTAGHSQVSIDKFRTVFIHEFGHLIGLDHSQINLNCLTNRASCPVGSADLAGVPTMFPVLLDVSQGILKTDDKASLSQLYPAGNFESTTGRIRGRVVFSDGVTPAQGYNVIARKVGDARITAVSSVSGYLFTPCGENTLAPAALRSCGYGANSSLYPYGSDDQTLIGVYDIRGLPAGDYTIEVEAIHNTGEHAFIDGSGVGPIGATLGFQFKMPWNPAGLTVTVTANHTEEGEDVILNGTPPRYDAWEDAGP